jgi:hypothetical protein
MIGGFEANTQESTKNDAIPEEKSPGIFFALAMRERRRCRGRRGLVRPTSGGGITQAAVAFERKRRRLINHPESLNLVFNESEIFRLIEELSIPAERIGRVLVDETAC